MTPRLSLALVFAAALVPAVVAAQPAQPAQPAGYRVPVPAPVARMQPPAGWTEDARTAVRVEGALAVEGAVFPGAAVEVDAQAWMSSPPGAALIATQATTVALPADPAAAATAALHDLRAGADSVGGAKVTKWELKLDPAGKVHEATLEWSDTAVGITSLGRALVYRANGALVRIGGECIIGPDGAAARASCETALASIGPTATSFELLAASGTPPSAEERPPGPQPSGGSDAPGIRPRDGDIPSTLAVRPGPKQADRRPFYVIGGIAVLGLVFWWNRREREKREAADRAEQAKAADDKAADDKAADDKAAAIRDAKKTMKLTKNKPSSEDEEPS